MNAVTVAWVIAACVWAFVSGYYRYRAKKLKEEAASNWRVAQYNADEVRRAHERRRENHRRMNRFARKCKQRGKTIETLERRIGILNAQILVTDGINAMLAPQVDALKTEKGKLTIENGRLKEELKQTDSDFRTLEQNYETMWDENKELKAENETLKQRNKGLEARIEEADKKLIEMSKQYETKIAELKRHDNCPFRRTAKNRISYCMKEDK